MPHKNDEKKNLSQELIYEKGRYIHKKKIENGLIWFHFIYNFRLFVCVYILHKLYT